jgi:hypothetical protein
MSRNQRIIYIVVTLLGAVFVLTYRGPLWPYVRGYMGDWLIVQFIYLIARFWIGYRWHYQLAVAVLLFSFAVEAIQYFAAGIIPSGVAADLTVGHTFDPVDIATYVLGIITVLLVEHFLSRRARTPQNYPNSHEGHS